MQKLDATLSDPKQCVDLSLNGEEPKPSIPSYAAVVRTFNFHQYGTKPELNVSSSRLHRISISQGKKKLALRGCYVGTLSVSGDGHELVLSDCYIGSLQVQANVLVSLTMENCVVLAISLPNGNPFAGSIILKNVWLPREGNTLNVQMLRNARACLIERHNQLAAGVFHSAELALDRKNEPFWSRVFSYIYEVGCDFGNSISRPVKWFGFSIAAMMWVVLRFDCVQPTDIAQVAGTWHADLATLPLLRAFVYAVQSVFNPLGVLSKTLLVATTWYWSLMLTTLSLIGTTALGFVVIGLRRRFKLE